AGSGERDANFAAVVEGEILMKHNDTLLRAALVQNNFARSASDESRGAAEERSNGRRPWLWVVEAMSAVGAKESFAAPRLTRSEFPTTAFGRGYALSPLRGSIRTRLRRAISFALSLFASVFLCLAQDQPYTIRVKTQLIVETVIVNDKDGKPIEGLTKD